MTIDRLYELFAMVDSPDVPADEVLRGVTAITRRSDLVVMLLLDRILPGSRRILAAATHDLVYFDVSLDELAAAATDAEVLALIYYGCFLQEDSLAMGV